VEIRRRTDYKDLKKVGRPAIEGSGEAPPAGIAGILRPSWNFAQGMANRFGQELNDQPKRAKEFLKALLNKF
jgi:hypothetical protein